MPVEVLVVVCLVVGMLPALTVGPLLAVAAQARRWAAPLPDYSLALWHGFNLPLLMSAVALGAGVGLYFVPAAASTCIGRRALPASGKHVLRRCSSPRAARLAARADRRAADRPPAAVLLACIVVAAVVAAGWPLLRAGLGAPATRRSPPARRRALAGDRRRLFAVGAAAAIGTAACYRRRFVALVLLGVVGLVVSLASCCSRRPTWR